MNINALIEELKTCLHEESKKGLEKMIDALIEYTDDIQVFLLADQIRSKNGFS